MKYFQNITWNIAELKKIPKHSIPCTLGQKKSSIWKKYQICIDRNDIWAVLRIPKNDIPLDFSRYWKNYQTFLNRVFCNLFKIPVIKYDPAGVTWPWPWVTEEANEFMVRFFWDWVYIISYSDEKCPLCVIKIINFLLVQLNNKYVFLSNIDISLPFFLYEMHA